MSQSFSLNKWNTDLMILKPRALQPGDTLGVFTPSSPGYIWNEGLFTNGLKNLENLGFKIKLGTVTSERLSEGYRSASAEKRAEEFMDLIKDPSVGGLISTIGGYNSSSLIPYLDFARIRLERKVICGYSDVASLHMAIQKFAGLSTIYGPAVMCWFGDWPNGCPESTESFLAATSIHREGARVVEPPRKWSNHKRNWENGDWQKIPRQWTESDGWRVLNRGTVEGQIVALNFNTCLSAAGTPYWPDLQDKILLLEDMEAAMTRTERGLRQLQYMDVFDKISGLIIGKPESYDQQGAPFGYEELFLEVVGSRQYPIVSNFDCGHTLPMISIPQLCWVRLTADDDHASFAFLEAGVE